MSPADDFDKQLSDNRTAFLRSVAEDLRQRLPLDAMLPSESTAYRMVPDQDPGGGGGLEEAEDDAGVFADAATLAADGARRRLPVRRGSGGLAV